MSRSLARNAGYNMIYQLLNALFPLLSAGYVARILGPEGVGTVASAQNIVSYFTMIAVMGIPAYGTREVARTGENRQALNQLFSELLALNAISTAIAAAGFGLLTVGFFPDSFLLYSVVSLELLFNFFNIDWFYQGREEYGYITARNLVVKVISLAALFVFVRQKQDYILYALIHSLAIGCNSCFNIIHAGKSVSVTVRNLDLNRHLKPVLFLMMSGVTASLYNKVDITMLSAMADPDSVAFYVNSHKVVAIVLTLVTSISAVFLPRLSYCYSAEREKYEAYLSQGLKIVLLLAVPACIGLVLVSEDMMQILFGTYFLPAADVLRVLAVFTIIKGAGDILCYQAIISSGNERMLIGARIAAGIANILLNAAMIPGYGPVGAAIASVAAEIVVNGMLLRHTLSFTKVRIEKRYLFSLAVSCTGMMIAVLMIRRLLNHRILSLPASVITGIAVYGLLLVLTRNELAEKIMKKH